VTSKGEKSVSSLAREKDKMPFVRLPEKAHITGEVVRVNLLTKRSRRGYDEREVINLPPEKNRIPVGAFNCEEWRKKHGVHGVAHNKGDFRGRALGGEGGPILSRVGGGVDAPQTGGEKP